MRGPVPCAHRADDEVAQQAAGYRLGGATAGGEVAPPVGEQLRVRRARKRRCGLGPARRCAHAVGDADRRRGELALLGLESSIEQMDTDTGSWHRVYIGPFDSRSAMAKARALTAQSDIDTLLLKRAQ